MENNNASPIKFPGDQVVYIPTKKNQQLEAIMKASSAKTHVGFKDRNERLVGSRENSTDSRGSVTSIKNKPCRSPLGPHFKSKRKPSKPQQREPTTYKRPRMSPITEKRSRISPAKDRRSSEGISTSSAAQEQSSNQKITNFFSTERTPNNPDNPISTLATRLPGNTPGKNKDSIDRPLNQNLEMKEIKHDINNSEVEALREKLRQSQEKLKQTSSALQQTETQLESMVKNEQVHKSKVANILVENLKDLARHQKREIQNQLLKDRFRIGQVMPSSEGHEIHDVWEPGEDYKTLKMRRIEIKRNFDKLQASRKELRQLKQLSRSKTKTEKSDGFAKPEPAVPLTHEIMELGEIHNLRSQTLKKELADLQLEEEKLEVRKQQVIRSHRRVQDELHSRFNNFPILHERYLLLHLLGKGGFSEVYKAFDLEDLRYVCCKIHQINEHWSDSQKKNYSRHATREYEIQKNLDHPRIVRLFDVFGMSASSFVTVLEFCDAGDLDLLLKNRTVLSEREARSIIMQVFSGLQYLNRQKRKIIHYDLKPANILFHEGQVKLTDFGLSKIMNDNPGGIELTSQGAGTMWYLPPECFVKNSVITSKVDTWSAGVVLYQMLVGQKPFGHGMSQDSLVRQGTIRNARKVAFPEKCKVSQTARDFISRCLAYYPQDRPDILDIFNETYFQTGKKSNKA